MRGQMDRNAPDPRPRGSRNVEDRLRVLMPHIEAELRKLLESRTNFKMTVNGTAGGGAVEVEIVKRVRVT